MMALTAGRAAVHSQAGRDIDDNMSQSSIEDGGQQETDEERQLAQRNMQMVKQPFHSDFSPSNSLLSSAPFRSLTINGLADQPTAGLGHWQTRIRNHMRQTIVTRAPFVKTAVAAGTKSGGRRNRSSKIVQGKQDTGERLEQ
jgi:hypothetical protein